MHVAKQMICAGASRFPRVARRRFLRSEAGGAAVDFALVLLPFLTVLMVIIESAIVLFAGQVLQTAATNAARLILTGQAQTASYSAAQFKNAVCANLTVMFNCANNLYVDVAQLFEFHRRQPVEPHQRQRHPEYHRFRLCARQFRRHRRGPADLPMADHRRGNRLLRGDGMRPRELGRQYQHPGRDRGLPQRTLHTRHMITRPNALQALVAVSARFAADRRGSSAVEFALLLPLMLIHVFRQHPGHRRDQRRPPGDDGREHGRRNNVAIQPPYRRPTSRTYWPRRPPCSRRFRSRMPGSRFPAC